MGAPILSTGLHPNRRRASWLAAASLFIFLISSGTAFAISLDDDDAPGQCSKADSLETRIREQEARLTDSNLSDSTRRSIERELENKRDQVVKVKDSCERRDNSRQREQRACERKIAEAGEVWKWDAKKNECVDMAAKNQKNNPNSGECNNAELMKGNLQGQNCKVAADTIKDATTRSQAINETALGATQAYSTMQAMQATGQQSDALNRQENVLKGLAAVKLLTAVNDLSTAASLKTAASGAEGASKSISSAYKDLNDYCNQDAVVSKMSMEQCFYKKAPEVGVDPTQKNYATFERMRSGADQSQQQADRANALAKSSMVTGAANALVGLQALYMSRQTAQTATAMGQVVPPTGMALGPMGASTGGSVGLGAGGPIAAGGGPSGGEGVSLGGNDGGQIKGSLMGSRPGAVNSYRAATSGISGGGGLGGGGGGRGGYRGASRGRGGMKSNTASGEYTNASVAPGSRGGGSEKEAAGAGGNPLGDMMCKLFPCNDAGKPIVDGRNIASEQKPEGEENPDDNQGSGVTTAELSIFEQVSTRYRALNGAGNI